jgi:RNA polymerase sigma-70 factor, ECF subfamily
MSSASMLATEAAATRGSAQAQERLARLFAEHHPMIWRTLRRLGCSPALAAQMTEQVCLAAASELRGVSREAHRQHERALVLSLVMRQLPRAQPVPSPRAAVLQAADESVVLMDRVLQRMSRPAVVVFILFELEGLSLDEVGSVMGMDKEAALHALSRAREEFTPLVAELRGKSR